MGSIHPHAAMSRNERFPQRIWRATERSPVATVPGKLLCEYAPPAPSSLRARSFPEAVDRAKHSMRGDSTANSDNFQ